jgi:hypothetical protein
MYCGMVAHKQHRDDFLMIHSVFSNGPVTREEVHVLPNRVKTIYSVLWYDSHYVAMECNLAKRCIGIYDGFTRHTSDDMAIEEELCNLRDEILKDELLTKPKKTIPLATAFRLEYETAEGKDEIGGEAAVNSGHRQSLVSCKCKSGCTKRCQCVKNGRGCGRICVCRGA